MEKQRITLLGSTGSIGVQTLDVARFRGLSVDAIGFGSDIKKGEEQIRAFSPRFCAVADEKAARELKTRVKDTNVKIYAGNQGICDMIADSASDVCLNAISGFAGLLPTMAALSSCRRLALVNKETLVAAGEIVMKTAADKGCEIIPVDSEHSAIFQCLQAGKKREVKKLILTCSGGAFFGYTKERLRSVTREQALGHPTWNMGAKITVDCASLMNKGLEVIEAMHLFSLPPEQIQVVIHRESIIHSMVEYLDNTVVAQLGVSDMRMPIGYALSYPDRAPLPGEALDFAKLGKLTFFRPDTDTFPLLSLAVRSAGRGGIIPCAMNAANEEAVRLFLDGKIGFTDIFTVVEEVTDEYADQVSPTFADILSVNEEARERVREKVR